MRLDRVAKRISRILGVVTVAALAFSSGSMAQTISVVMHHNDRARTGQNLAETILTPSNVNTKHFGPLFTQSVDGLVVAQPLYMQSLNVNGVVHDVVFVATAHNSVYAFDANDNLGPNRLPLWSVNFGPSVPADEQGCNTVTGFTEVGIVGTPVIDPASHTMYVVAKTKENSVYIHRLHALDIKTGLEQPGSPVVITASYVTGGNQVTFTDQHHMQRSALLLSKGVLYIPFGTMGCKNAPPSTGWMMAYDPVTFQQVGLLDVGPTQDAIPGIWMGGDGPAADVHGNLFVVTGDGVFDYNAGGLDYGDSVLKLTLGGGSFVVSDYFTPFNQADLLTRDRDLGSSGLVLLPDQPGPFPHLGVMAGKQGMIYLLNQDNLGQYSTSGDAVVQEIPFDPNGETLIFGGATYWNNFVYFGARGKGIESFSLNNGLLSNTPAFKTSSAYNTSSLLSISANGAQNGILWGIERVKDVDSSILDAFDATNLNLLYSSVQNPTRDALHTTSHFVLPTIANGRVYLGTTQNLVVMGLLAKLKPTGGNNKTGQAGTWLRKPLEITLLDVYTGAPIRNQTVTFSDGGAGGVFSKPVTVTNNHGVATTRYQLPPTPGVYAITATNPNFITGKFTETATAALSSK